MGIRKIDIYLSEAEIKSRIRELGAEISKAYGDEPVCLICILKGSVFFTCELAQRITSPVELEFMSVSGYGNRATSSGVVRVVNGLVPDIVDRNILIVEDIIDTGKTLKFLMEYVARKHPKSLRACTLLDKPDRRTVGVEVDFTGFVIPDKYAVGFGMDYKQRYRNLPYIGFAEIEE